MHVKFNYITKVESQIYNELNEGLIFILTLRGFSFWLLLSCIYISAFIGQKSMEIVKWSKKLCGGAEILEK